MATSGTYEFPMGRNQLIADAFEELNVVGQGQPLSASLLAKGQRTLNSMLQRWAATEIHVWTVTEGVLIPQAGQVKYKLGPSSADHVTFRDQLITTEIATDVVSGASTIEVEDAGAAATTNYIGVQVDDATIHWTTINGAPAGNTIQLTTGLDDSAMAGATVFIYESKIPQPLKIVHGRRMNFTTGNETELGDGGKPTARLDYQRFTLKANAGPFQSYFYDRQRGDGYLYLYQVPSVITEQINFTWHRTIQIMASATDDFDLPQEWFDTLKFNLALMLATGHHVPAEKLNAITAIATTLLDQMKGADREEGPILFQPRMR
jgi:hypothetical protein